MYGHRLCGAVPGTGPAFHARVTVFNPGVSVVHAENSMGTNNEAHAAAYAFFLVKLQSNHVLEIDESSHVKSPLG